MAPPNAARRFARRSSFKLQNFPAQPLQLDKPARKIAFRRARRRGLKLPSALRIRRSHLTDRWLFVIEQPIDLKIEPGRSPCGGADLRAAKPLITHAYDAATKLGC